MKDLLDFIVKNIVSNIDDVLITEKPGQFGETILEVKVNPEDMGLIIGKGGKIIKSIRNLIRTKAIIDRKKVNVMLVEQ